MYILKNIHTNTNEEEENNAKFVQSNRISCGVSSGEEDSIGWNALM